MEEANEDPAAADVATFVAAGEVVPVAVVLVVAAGAAAGGAAVVETTGALASTNLQSSLITLRVP